MTSLSGREWLAIVAHQRQPLHLREPGSVVRLSVPIHGNRPLKIGLFRHLAKLAEIADDELR
jgi:hypothetical protein